jgi:hypothetical protein
VFQGGNTAIWSEHVEIYKEGVGKNSEFVRIEMVDGSNVSFWHDVLCGEQPLKICYLGLFSITRCKDVLVADLMQFQNGSIHWNIILPRPI